MRSKKPKLVKLVGAVSPATSLSMSGDQDSVSATEAARELNISSRSLRRLAEAGKIPTFRTPGGYVRVRRRDLDAFKSLSSSIVPAIPSRVDSAREENQMLSLELQHKKLRRDLQRVDEEDAEAKRKRAAAVADEQARIEAARAQARLEQEEREQQEEEEWARQAEFDRRQQWADSWLAYGLTSLPFDLPREFMLQVQPAIEDTLRTVNPTRPPAIVQQLVLAAIQQVIAPWQRQREIEQAIKQATKELPLDVRQYSDMFPDLYPPTEWEARAISTAREAVSQLAGNVSLAEIHAAAVAAGRQVASEYVAEQARAREEKQRAAAEEARAREERRRAAIKACLVSQGVAEVGRHLREQQSRDEIHDKDLARQVEIEKLVRATLEQRLTGSESSSDALRMVREVVNEEVGTSRRSASMMSKRSRFMV